MGLKAEAILPSSYTSSKKAKASIDKLLLTAKEGAMKRLQTYPTWQPWKNPPKTGLRAGGKRTGDLGRNWNSYTLKSGQSIEMKNEIGYAGYVQGKGSGTPRQAKALAARGWPRIDEVAEEAAKEAISKTKMDA